MILNYCSIGPSLSIQKKKSKIFLRTTGASTFFFFIERRWRVLQGGVSFWHTMILLLLFCYLITIPKHINDMEDIVVTPNLMFIFCCFCVNFTFVFFIFHFFFISFLILQMQLMKKKQRGKQKPT